MEVKHVYYNDDDILIPGHLIKRRFRKPVFYPFGNECGFSYEIISNEDLIAEYSAEVYRQFYKDTYPKGTVDSVDDAPTIHCKFDNRRCLGIIPGVDAFRKILEDI